MLVIACAGVGGWLLLLLMTLCLGAAAKRADELELGAQRYLPDSREYAEVVPIRPTRAGDKRPPAWCANRSH